MITPDINENSEVQMKAQPKIYASQADLDPKDHALLEMRDWCEKQGDIVVLHSGLILTSDLTSRGVQNCRIMLANKGLRAGRVVLATQELITMLLSNIDDEKPILTDPALVSVQQQRLRMLVREALEAQVSDIHIEVRSDIARVRFRKHGELYLHTEWVPRVGREIASVAFNKETDHAITHFNPNVPQGASMPMHIDGTEVRLRLASMPAHSGFDMVMRILSMGDENIPLLKDLGYTDYQVSIIEKAMRMPHGAILVAGPTGSGKTTTMASCMQLVPSDHKIFTIEDPVEKIVSNATQVPVNTEKEDRDFASMGRTALRMDPDVIVLGEMRDEDTAQVLVRAAITGHLVLSTIHTNSATNIVTRLVDMGISSVLLGDNNLLVCLMFQRLIPKLCQHCAKPITEKDFAKEKYAQWKAFFGTDFAKLRLRGQQCTYCKNRGISGRTVVAEVIWVDEAGRHFIQKRDTLGWETYLRENGWQSYRDHALSLVRQGICDPRDAEKIMGEIHSTFSDSQFDYRNLNG